MSGAFAAWQPEYARHGIPTFPVRIEADGKRPAVKNYLQLGAGYSQALATRFPECEAFGFGVGRRSNVTVLDVDTPDETVLADALDRHGETPIVIRTGGGKFHAWYRHNGERRMIRPDRSRPIDILGAGYVIAPPSRGARTPYQFLQGSLDDLGRLPVLRNVPALAPSPKIRSAAPTATAGARNDTLFKRCLAAARWCDDLDSLIDVARTENDNFAPPLEDGEVVKTAGSAWSYEQSGRNFVGRGEFVITPNAEIYELEPDPLYLLLRLRSHHWGRDFAVANAMAETLGWTRARFTRARAALETAGAIAMVRAPSQRRTALYRWPHSRLHEIMQQ